MNREVQNTVDIMTAENTNTEDSSFKDSKDKQEEDPLHQLELNRNK